MDGASFGAASLTITTSGSVAGAASEFGLDAALEAGLDAGFLTVNAVSFLEAGFAALLAVEAGFEAGLAGAARELGRVTAIVDRCLETTNNIADHECEKLGSHASIAACNDPIPRQY